MSLSLHSIQQALLRIDPYLKPTPLFRCEELEKELIFPGKIFLKSEYAQPTGSFKVRGAFNALLELLPMEKSKGVVTRSSGNFAQAVAFVAQLLKIPAMIVIPENTPLIKVEGTKKFSPTILFSGNTHAEGEQIVAQLVREKKLTPLHPYNHYHTMEGQGTAALEILEVLPEVDHFYCPIGGGGLLSGCATAFKETKPSIKIHGVEPIGAGDYYLSRQSGKQERLEHVNTIADGLRAPSVGKLNYPILNKYVDDDILVSDPEIQGAMKWLYENMQIVIEPSGAASLAGFMKNIRNIRGNVVVLLSGKNIDLKDFYTLIA